jgi:hypothetical protein
VRPTNDVEGSEDEEAADVRPTDDVEGSEDEEAADVRPTNDVEGSEDEEAADVRPTDDVEGSEDEEAADVRPTDDSTYCSSGVVILEKRVEFKIFLPRIKPLQVQLVENRSSNMRVDKHRGQKTVAHTSTVAHTVAHTSTAAHTVAHTSLVHFESFKTTKVQVFTAIETKAPAPDLALGEQVALCVVS